MKINQEHFPEPDIKPDRSVLYFALIMGAIVLIMALLSIFMEDIRLALNPPEKPAVFTENANTTKLLTQTAAMDDEQVKASLIKFIEAFYVDQKKGYFDPPSYFTPITETYYNFHHLTYQRLRQIHFARLADLKNLDLTWMVHTLNFERRNDSLVATFWTKQSYFKPSKNAQESADILLEMRIDKEGKIASLKELDIANLVSTPQPNRIDSVVEHNVKIQPVAAPMAENKPKPPVEAQVYNSGVLDFPPEFPGGNKKLLKYLNRNLNYPKAASDKNVQGKVFISFVVEPNGDLNNLKVIRGIGSGCDEEAIRVLRNSPKWKAGMLDGKPVRSAYVLPIIFQLAD